MQSDHPQLVLIEDNPADIQLIKIALKRNGVECDLRQYVRGIDAVRELCTPEDVGDAVPDAILMDLNTPGTDGFDALRTLKNTAWLSAVPIAVLTSSRCHSDRERARELGVNFIEKPSDFMELFRLVTGAVKKMLAANAVPRAAVPEREGQESETV